MSRGPGCTSLAKALRSEDTPLQAWVVGLCVSNRKRWERRGEERSCAQARPREEDATSAFGRFAAAKRVGVGGALLTFCVRALNMAATRGLDGGGTRAGGGHGGISQRKGETQRQCRWRGRKEFEDYQKRGE